jgi:hypothetical protein
MVIARISYLRINEIRDLAAENVKLRHPVTWAMRQDNHEALASVLNVEYESLMRDELDRAGIDQSDGVRVWQWEDPTFPGVCFSNLEP